MENRRFGIVMSAAFGTVFVLKAVFSSSWSFSLFCVCLVFGITAWKKSQWLEYPRRAWIFFGICLGKVTHPLIMGLVYFGVITPIGIVRRKLKGHSSLEKETFWIARQNSKTVTRETLRRLF